MQLACIEPVVLAGLLRDQPGALHHKMMQLKALLPGADVGRVAAAQPQLLLKVRRLRAACTTFELRAGSFLSTLERQTGRAQQRTRM